MVESVGAWDGRGKVRVPLASGGLELGVLWLGPRRGGRAYDVEDLAALSGAAAAVADGVMVGRRARTPPTPKSPGDGRPE